MTSRPLTTQEIKILHRLLSVSFPGSVELKKQILNCEASSTGDNDNYGSVYLITQADQADVRLAAEAPLRVPVEGLVDDIDGEPINILLHVVKGFVHELEIVKLNGTPLVSKIDPEKIKVHINS